MSQKWHLDMAESEDDSTDDIGAEGNHGWWHWVIKLFGCCSSSDYTEL